MPFDAIIGQSRPLMILKRMLHSGNVAHALLFSGIAGVGKHTTARALSRALNCAGGSADFCGVCPSCKKTATGMHPDIMEIAPPPDKHVIKIDQIRSLQNSIIYAPVEGPWRVVIIDQAERLNKEAANCPFKTLEEPPQATVLILIASSAARLLPTVVSRCQKIAFAPLSGHDIRTLLERAGIPADTAARAAAHAHGSLHRARQLLDGSLLEDFNRLASMMIARRAADECFEMAATLAKAPDRLPALLILLLEWLRDMRLCRHGAHAEQLFNPGQADALMHAARQIEPLRLNRQIAQVCRLMDDPQRTYNMQLGLESLLLS